MEPSSGLAHWKRNTNLRLSQPFKFIRKQLLVDQLSNSFVYRDSSVTSDDHRLYLGGRFTKLPPGQSEILKPASIYNAGPRSLYLIRPDGYIAARRFDSDFQDIAALVRHAVGEDIVDTQTRLRRASGGR